VPTLLLGEDGESDLHTEKTMKESKLEKPVGKKT